MIAETRACYRPGIGYFTRPGFGDEAGIFPVRLWRDRTRSPRLRDRA